MILRRVTSLELIQYGIRGMIWLEMPIVFWLSEGTISLSGSMYMAFVN